MALALPWEPQDAGLVAKELPLDKFYQRFHLHTNAAGDFPAGAPSGIHEDPRVSGSLEVYMHTDQLCGACGCQRRAIGKPSSRHLTACTMQITTVPHAPALSKQCPGQDHEKVLSQIMRGERSYQLNTSSWGLADKTLEIRHQNIQTAS